MDIASISRAEHEDLFASVDELTASETVGPPEEQTAAAGTDGPMLELLPHGSTFDEPVSVSFDISSMVAEQPQATEGAVLLVLRQSGEDGPWLPLPEDELLTVDAEGKATVQLRSFSNFR